MAYARRFVFTLIAALLAGCGFHLRGVVDMPRWLNQVAVVVENAHRDLCPQLKKQLETYHVQICAPTDARYLLIVEHDDFQQQITSISSSTVPRQYQLIYRVRFRLVEHRGKEIIPSSLVFVTRQVTINGDRILGSDDEEAIIKNEMIRDAVIQIINRLG